MSRHASIRSNRYFRVLVALVIISSLSGCAEEKKIANDVSYYIGLSPLEGAIKDNDGYISVYINENFIKRLNPSGTMMTDKFFRKGENSFLLRSSYPKSVEVTLVKLVNKNESVILFHNTISASSTLAFEVDLQDFSLPITLDPLLTKERAEDDIKNLIANIHKLIINKKSASLVRILCEGEMLRGQEGACKHEELRWKKVFENQPSFVSSDKLNFEHGSDLVFVYSGKEGSEKWKNTLLLENTNGADLHGIHFARFKGRWIVW